MNVNVDGDEFEGGKSSSHCIVVHKTNKYHIATKSICLRNCHNLCHRNTHFPPCIQRPVNAQNIQFVFRSVIFLPINGNTTQFSPQFHYLFNTQKTLHCVPLVFHSVNESKGPLVQHSPLCGDRQTTGYWSEYGNWPSLSFTEKHGCFHPAIFENASKSKKNGKADLHLYCSLFISNVTSLLKL